MNIELTFYRAVYCNFSDCPNTENFSAYVKLVLFYPVYIPLSDLNFKGRFFTLAFSVVNVFLCS